MSEQNYRIRPRNDFVILKIEKVDQLRGLAMPEVSAEGKRFVVEAVGPKVEDLKKGDVIRLIGTQSHGNWSYIPGYSDLLMTREENVVIVFEPVVSESAYEKATEDRHELNDR